MTKNQTLKVCSLPVIHTIGRSNFDPIWAEQEHVDPYSELMFVLQGQVMVKTPSYTLAGQEGDTLYTPKGLPHRDVFPAGSMFEVYLIQFHWRGERAWSKCLNPVQLSKAARVCRRFLAEDFTRLFHEFTSHRELNYPIVQLRLLEILYQLQQSADQSPSIKRKEDEFALRRHRLMRQAREIIQEQFHRQISLETIADALGISSYYLSRIFSEESGFTLCHYLTQVRMEKAAELLRDVRLNISEVAFQTGFKDSHYFSRVFKAYFGCSPKMYCTRPAS